jgi:hypothetical protein
MEHRHPERLWKLAIHWRSHWFRVASEARCDPIEASENGRRGTCLSGPELH